MVQGFCLNIAILNVMLTVSDCFMPNAVSIRVIGDTRACSTWNVNSEHFDLG